MGNAPYTWSPTATMYRSDSSTSTMDPFDTNSPTSTMYPSASDTMYPTYSPTTTDFPSHTIPYYKGCVKKNNWNKKYRFQRMKKMKIPEDITYKKAKKNKNTKEVEKKKG